MNSKELRQNFIDYFTKKKGHTFIRSSSVSPIDDPAILDEIKQDLIDNKILNNV